VPAGDRGFSLVETMVAISLLAVVVLAAVPFFIGTLRSSAGLGVTQVAVTVASHQLEYIRSVPAENLVSGRNASDVAALIADPGAVRLTDDVLATGNSDPGAAPGSSSAIVRLTDTQTLNGTAYIARNFINLCYLSRTSGTCTSNASNGTAMYRVSVAVSWPKRPGVQCVTGYQGRCEYVAVTLIDSSQDPVFAIKLPSITSFSPLVASRLPQVYTVTGSDFQATPSLPGIAGLPLVTLSGTRTGYGVTGIIDPMLATGVSFVNSNSITFIATMPWNNGLGYTASLTVSVTNPDGGTTSRAFTVTVL
jgi:prepilin-type N-terminal cleavage/methylation domain-containing protein